MSSDGLALTLDGAALAQWITVENIALAEKPTPRTTGWFGGGPNRQLELARKSIVCEKVWITSAQLLAVQ